MTRKRPKPIRGWCVACIDGAPVVQQLWNSIHFYRKKRDAESDADSEFGETVQKFDLIPVPVRRRKPGKKARKRA